MPNEPLTTGHNSRTGSQGPSSREQFEFGPFLLDLERYELQRAGRRLHLNRIPMDLLILLIKHRGLLVSREEIAGHLWPQPGLVDVEGGTNTAIRRIRETLGDDPGKPRYIETVVGKGYRFIAEVSDISTGIGPNMPPNQKAEIVAAELPPAASLEAPLDDGTDSVADRRLVLSCLVLLVALTLSLAFAFWQRRSHENEASAGFLEQVTTNDSEQRVTASALSPDGRWIAYADPNAVSLRVLQTGVTAPLKGPEDFRSTRIAWFPDQLKLLISGYSVRDASPAIWTVFITGSPPQLFRSGADNGVPSPDGTHILFTVRRGAELRISGVDGENEHSLLIAQAGYTFPVIFWSADSRRACYLRRRTVLELGDYGSALAASGRIVAVEKGVEMDSASSLSDGRIAFLRDSAPHLRDAYTIWQVRTDSRTGAFLSNPMQVAALGKPKAFSFSSSEDGSKMSVVLEQGSAHAYVGMLRSPGPTLVDVRRLNSDTRTDYPKTWLHDSQTIIFESNRSGVFRLYKQLLADRAPEQLNTGAEQAVLPQVSSDGKWILYAAKPNLLTSSRDQLFRIPVKGGTPVQIPVGHPLGEFTCPVFGQHGCILREAPGEKEFVFYRLDPLAGKGDEIGRASWQPHVVEDWCVSPDGAFAALTSHEEGISKIRLVPLTRGSQEKKIEVKGFNRLSGIKWSPDNQGWFVASDTNTGSLILYVDRSGKARVLRDVPLSSWAVPSPDNRKLAFVDQTVDSNVWLWSSKPNR